MVRLTEAQRHTLNVIDVCPVSRWSDGRWRELGANPGHPGHAHDDVRVLKAVGYVEMMPIGAIITDAGRAALSEGKE